MCKTKDESVVLTQYHTFIFLPFWGFNPRHTNLKFHNRYNSTPNFYLHSTYVGRQPVWCTSYITTYVQWKALSSFHSFNSPAHLDISRRFDVLEQIRDYRLRYIAILQRKEIAIFEDIKVYKLMPGPFTGPKICCAGPNVLSQSKNLIAFSASSKTFVPAQKPILLNANHLLVWHKMFVTGKICK